MAGKRTPLYEKHRALGARMTDFAGWEMPVSYRGILDEHRAVRTHVGLFDVSHMGVVEIVGADAARVCQVLTTNDVRGLVDGRAQYSLMCNERGGILDDVIVYRLAAERYMFCVNAANTEKDLSWMREHADGRVNVLDRSGDTALLALQGPGAVSVLSERADRGVVDMAPFDCTETRVSGVSVILARTGYTGGDGFELFVSSTDASALWDDLLGGGGSGPVEPVGLGARDTLRLEAGLLLHGIDMDDETSPLEASLGWVVKLDAGPFIGRDALRAEASVGPARRLVKIRLDGAGIPRHDHSVVRDGEVVGKVTSGSLSPMLKTGIALGYVDPACAIPGTKVAVDIRGRLVEGEVVRGPFFKPNVKKR